MHIFLDESGSFVPGVPNPESWCVVAGYAVPEAHRRRVEAALARLKRAVGRRADDEIKLRDVRDERDYLAFLRELDQTAGTLYASATDAHRNAEAAVRHHQARQVEKMVEHIPQMKHAEARRGLQDRADRFAGLSPQLYLQVQCQYTLLSRILRYALLYYAQRLPATLAHFRWRVDRKNQHNSVFDDAFRDFAASFLQTMSFKNPLPMLIGADYRHFQRFFFEDGPPAYLKDTYGLDVGEGFHVTKVMREDFAFVDSRSCPGVQVADLLVSGMRRCLRGDFADNPGIAVALGALTVGAIGDDFPIDLLSLDPAQARALHGSTPSDQAVRTFRRAARPWRLKR